jgi:hypothetical protein
MNEIIGMATLEKGCFVKNGEKKMHNMEED